MADRDWTDLAHDRDCGMLLQTRRMFGFGKMWRVYQLAKEPLASQEELYPMELTCQSVHYLSLDI